MGTDPIEAVEACKVAVKEAYDGAVLDVEDSQMGVCEKVSEQIDADEKLSEHIAGWLCRGGAGLIGVQPVCYIIRRLCRCQRVSSSTSSKPLSPYLGMSARYCGTGNCCRLC